MPITKRDVIRELAELEAFEKVITAQLAEIARQRHRLIRQLRDQEVRSRRHRLIELRRA